MSKEKKSPHISPKTNMFKFFREIKRVRAGEPDDAYYCFNFGVNTYIKFPLKYTYILNFSVT